MRIQSVRFSDDVWAAIQREAEEGGMSASQFVREAALVRVSCGSAFAPALPSHLTLGELRVVHVFAERFAAEADEDENAEVSLLVRDRGRDGTGLASPWVEFSVGQRRFALWRSTLGLYEVGPDGAVGDEPLHAP